MTLEQKLKEAIKNNIFEPRIYDMIPVSGTFTYFARVLTKNMTEDEASNNLDIFSEMAIYHATCLLVIPSTILELSSQIMNYF